MVIQGTRSGEEHLGEVLDLVRALTRRVDDLTARVGELEASAPAREPAGAAPGAAPAPAAAAPSSVLSLLGQSRMLQRIAMISFALVVALVLRTLTDSRVIGVGVGVVLGIAYSALLVASGGCLMVRHGRGQGVLPACGAVLLCAVALEAYRKFQLVSADTVNWILIADLVIVGGLGLWFRIGSIVAIAVLAPTASALTVGFPNLEFPLAAGLFLLANGVAYLARRIGRLQWLAWATFAATMFFWLLWSMKARAHLLHRESTPGAELGVAWFLAGLLVFALFYAGTAVARALEAPRAPGAFHAFLPSGNALWAHPAGAAVLGPWTGGLVGLGVAGLAGAVAHMAVAGWLWRRLRERATSITAFTLAGVVLLLLAVPALADSLPLEVAVLAAAALGLDRFATVCGSPGLRACALGLQLAAGIVAVAGGLYGVPPASFAMHALVATVVAALSALQYRHERLHAPPAASWFARIDAANHASVLLLWMAAVHTFGTLRLLLDGGIGVIGIAAPDAFRCGQSVILNCASILMLLWGMRSGNRQVLLTAGLVVVFGGLKVFGSDLLTASGLPLVLAVFSFGMAAAVGSLMMGRVQRASATGSNGQPRP